MVRKERRVRLSVRLTNLYRAVRLRKHDRAAKFVEAYVAEAYVAMTKRYVQSKRPALIQLFQYACRDGQLETIEWLSQTFTANYIGNSDTALRIACRNGHLEVVKWIIYEFDLYDTQADNAFAVACAYGQLEIVQWLDCVMSVNVRASMIYDAMCNGHFNVANWIVRTYPGFKEYAFADACMEGKLEFAQGLVVEFPDINVHEDNDVAFQNACIYHNDHVAWWMLANFPNINMKENLVVLSIIGWTGSPELACRLLGYFTADEFWKPEVQENCKELITRWRNRVEPLRQEFMTNIAPYLEAAAASRATTEHFASHKNLRYGNA